MREDCTVVISTSGWPVAHKVFILCKNFAFEHGLEASYKAFVDSVKLVEFWKSLTFLQLELVCTV